MTCHFWQIYAFLFHFKSGGLFKKWKISIHSTAFNEDPKYENNKNLISSMRDKHVETGNDEFPSYNFFVWPQYK
jgi:hypothetical protein